MIEHIFSPLPPNSCGGSWSIMLVASEAKKGGGGKVCATPFDSDQAAWPLDERLLAVDEALAKLETLDRRAAKVIELRFFRRFDGKRSRGGAGNLNYHIETGLGFRAKLAGNSARMTNLPTRYSK